MADNSIFKEFGISGELLTLVRKAETGIRDTFKRIEDISEYNHLKVTRSMQKNRLSDTHFAGTTGYGYGDRGRDVLDDIYADVFRAEKALVRHNIVAGTHALSIAMSGNLISGDRLLSVTGKPYETLEQVIGLRGNGKGSLAQFGIEYAQVDSICNGIIDTGKIRQAITSDTKMVYVQRSRGYSWRRSLSVEDIAVITEVIKGVKDDIIVLVDNCYGEFAEEKEPVEAGADLVAGSLIKNPGGGIAPTGGYVAGNAEYVENAACRLTSPGLGSDAGPSLGHNRLLMQGLFFAPHAVSESLKGAVLCSAVMKKLGFITSPGPGEKRHDIIQAVRFKSREELVTFCQGIQSGSPVNSFAAPEPWDMPGYDCPVIMAAGGFVQGSSIELSADGPVKAPYTAYIQGGVIYESVKLGLLCAVQKLLDKGMANIIRKSSI